MDLLCPILSLRALSLSSFAPLDSDCYFALAHIFLSILSGFAVSDPLPSCTLAFAFHATGLRLVFYFVSPLVIDFSLLAFPIDSNSVTLTPRCELQCRVFVILCPSTLAVGFPAIVFEFRRPSLPDAASVPFQPCLISRALFAPQDSESCAVLLLHLDSLLNMSLFALLLFLTSIRIASAVLAVCFVQPRQ